MMESTLQAHVAPNRICSSASYIRSKVEESPEGMPIFKVLLMFKGLLAP
jgi:hypothetical protein